MQYYSYKLKKNCQQSRIIYQYYFFFTQDCLLLYKKGRKISTWFFSSLLFTRCVIFFRHSVNVFQPPVENNNDTAVDPMESSRESYVASSSCFSASAINGNIDDIPVWSHTLLKVKIFPIYNWKWSSVEGSGMAYMKFRKNCDIYLIFIRSLFPSILDGGGPCCRKKTDGSWWTAK